MTVVGLALWVGVQGAEAGKPRPAAEGGAPPVVRQAAAQASEACGRPISATFDAASFASGGASGIDPVAWCVMLVESVGGACQYVAGGDVAQAWGEHPLSTVVCRRDSRFDAYDGVARGRGEDAAVAEVMGGMARPELSFDGKTLVFGYFSGTVNLTSYTADALRGELVDRARAIGLRAELDAQVGRVREACGVPGLQLEVDLESLRQGFHPPVTQPSEFGREEIVVRPGFDETAVHRTVTPLLETLARVCAERPEIEDRVVMPPGGTGRVTRPTRPFPVDAVREIAVIRVVPDDRSDRWRAAGEMTGSQSRAFQEASFAGRYDALLMKEELDRMGDLHDSVYPTITHASGTLTVGVGDLTYGREGYGRGDLMIVRLLDLALAGR